VTAKVLSARTADLVVLMKPRIMVMALLTAAGAIRLAPATLSMAHELLVLAGTALIVGSANTLNMWLERDSDCLMARTKNRPLPTRRLDPVVALVSGALLGAVALPVLALAGIVPAALGLVALLLYVGVYTPMKQRTPWATWVGSVPGAMPALLGWTAATGRLDVGGLAVFAILFMWQVPHTHAIAIYRQRDYDAAGLKTLVGTRGLAVTRRAIAGWLVVQVALSLALVPLGVAGVPYLVTASVLGAFVLVQGWSGLRTGEARWARNVFLASIVYLPLLFGVMVLGGRPV
jgi:protoheme IX farnesyltransferase